MKAITIWQPWASLLAYGGKQFETRSWATSYRGPIAIHAASIKVPQVLKKLFPAGEYSDTSDYRAKKRFLDAVAKGLGGIYTTEELMEAMSKLPTGSVVATANLVGCHGIGTIETEGIRTEFGYLGGGNVATWYPITEKERLLGDWSLGRYAWEFTDMKQVGPIPAKGKQGLWEWKEEQ